MKKVIIWGMGAVYNKHVNLLKYLEMQGQISVVGITATKVPNIKAIDGYQIISIEKIIEVDFEYLIPMTDLDYREIVNIVTLYGIKMEQIIPYKVLDIPNICFDDYIELKKSDISIISNNCWGGIVYNTLGLECLSPFKNLFVEDNDYLKLLNDFKNYIGESLKFSHFSQDVHNSKRYPVMKLKDILIHCNHYDNPDEAIENWSRRCKKINYDNLFVEMYTSSESVARKFVRLQQYAKKICFVPFETTYKEMMTLRMYPGQAEFWEAVNSNATLKSNCYTYSIIDLLNMKKVYRSVIS